VLWVLCRALTAKSSWFVGKPWQPANEEPTLINNAFLTLLLTTYAGGSTTQQGRDNATTRTLQHFSLNSVLIITLIADVGE